MNRLAYLLAVCLLTPLYGVAQWQPQSVGTDASFRAVSVASANVAWIGGTKGTFVRTADGGKHGKRVRCPTPKPAIFGMYRPLMPRQLT